MAKIIYIGNFQPSHSTENHMSNSIESLGHRVTRMQENAVCFADILAEQKDNDFILYTRTWDTIGGDRDDFLAAKKLPLVGFSLDIWWGLARQAEVEKQLFFKSDYLFTADGGHGPEFHRAGINHTWLTPGVYRPECYIAEKNPEYEYDVIFVGSYGYHEEYPYRPQLIDWLRETYGDRFRLYGSGGECVRGHMLNEVYASAKVVVGDSYESPNYWSDRVPETLGRGGFLIHPYTQGMDMEYVEGRHYVAYSRGDFEQLGRIIDLYVANESARERIRLLGHDHVINKHTYAHRAGTLIDKMGRVL